MSIYTVQYGDTPMSIAQKMTGDPGRVSELVRANAHKPPVVAGPVLTFRSLHVGEQLTVPPRWMRQMSGSSLGRGPAKRKPHKPRNPSESAGHPTGVTGYAHAQQGPHFNVRPRAGAGGGGDDDGHGVEPILTVSGPHTAHRSSAPVAGTAGLPTGIGAGACCGSCAQGGPCEGGPDCVKMPVCSRPMPPSSNLPGDTSFPVGFGQTDTTPTSTLSTVGDALAGWGVPLTVGVIAVAAGFGLAYVISNR